MEMIGRGVIFLFSTVLVYFLLVAIGAILSIIGDRVLVKFGFSRNSGPFFIRDMFIGLVTILFFSGIFYAIGLIATNLFPWLF